MNCMDCGQDVAWNGLCEYYMVHNEVWQNAVPDIEGLLCIGCLEVRLGRVLTPSDFTKYPVNDPAFPFPKSDRLMNRLGYTLDDVGR